MAYSLPAICPPPLPYCLPSTPALPPIKLNEATDFRFPFRLTAVFKVDAFIVGIAILWKGQTEL